MFIFSNIFLWTSRWWVRHLARVDFVVFTKANEQVVLLSFGISLFISDYHCLTNYKSTIYCKQSQILRINLDTKLRSLKFRRIPETNNFALFLIHFSRDFFFLVFSFFVLEIEMVNKMYILRLYFYYSYEKNRRNRINICLASFNCVRTIYNEEQIETRKKCKEHKKENNKNQLDSKK